MRVFITGASGWIGSAVVPELLANGHEVACLARSDSSADALRAAGAEVERGSLDDLDTLAAAAGAADGVIHLAFKHELAFSGDFAAAAKADRKAIETFGEALAGTDRPFVIASGLLGLSPGRVSTEDDGHAGGGEATGGPEVRHANAELTLSFADRGVRSSVLRLPPTVHGDGDNGFMAMIVGIAREKGVSGYIGDGSNRWPAANRLDVAPLFRLALESAPAGSTLHAAAEEGVPMRDIATAIGRALDLPVESVAAADAGEHFSWMAGFLGVDAPAACTATRELLGWEPTHPGLLGDLEAGYYFGERTAASH